jgi:hypothetical protein
MAEATKSLAGRRPRALLPTHYLLPSPLLFGLRLIVACPVGGLMASSLLSALFFAFTRLLSSAVVFRMSLPGTLPHLDLQDASDRNENEVEERADSLWQQMSEIGLCQKEIALRTTT